MFGPEKQNPKANPLFPKSNHLLSRKLAEKGKQEPKTQTMVSGEKVLSHAPIFQAPSAPTSPNSVFQAVLASVLHRGREDKIVLKTLTLSNSVVPYALVDRYHPLSSPLGKTPFVTAWFTPVTSRTKNQPKEY